MLQTVLRLMVCYNGTSPPPPVYLYRELDSELGKLLTKYCIYRKQVNTFVCVIHYIEIDVAVCLIFMRANTVVFVNKW